MSWALQGETPWLYCLMRVINPSFTRRCDLASDNVVSYGLSAVRKARDAKISKYNIISGLIDASRSEGTNLTDFSLGSQASALIVAGSGTTAVTLTYAVWAILTHHTVRVKLEDELARIPEDYDDVLLEKLPYLNAVIMETLRLYGSAPGALPRITPAQGISVRDFFIPGGVTLTTQSYTMHRDQSIFSDPEV
jgi:cytochrome P450